jgi:hypothetical protein
VGFNEDQAKQLQRSILVDLRKGAKGFDSYGFLHESWGAREAIKLILSFGTKNQSRSEDAEALHLLSRELSSLTNFARIGSQGGAIYLSEKENIILCGLVDWVEYLEENNLLRVIDFKTGLKDEKDDSMQLPIYKVLVESLQKRPVDSGAYWYLDRDKFYKVKEIPDEDVELVKEKLLEIGKQIKKKKTAKTPKEVESNFKCKYSENGEGCKYCREVEMIYQFDKGLLSTDNAPLVKYLGVGEYKQDLYFVKRNK